MSFYPIIQCPKSCIVISDLAAAKDGIPRLLKQEPTLMNHFYVGFDIGGFELGLLPNEKEFIIVPTN